MAVASLDLMGRSVSLIWSRSGILPVTAGWVDRDTVRAVPERLAPGASLAYGVFAMG